MDEQIKYNEEKNNEVKKDNSSKASIIIIVLLILIIIGLASYIFLSENATENKTDNETKEETKAENEDKEDSDADNKEDNSSEDGIKEEEQSFDEAQVNEKLNDTFSELLNLFPSENDNNYLEDASGRNVFLILNFEKANLGTYEIDENGEVYTTVAKLKDVYKTFYGSLDNFSSDTTNSDYININGEKAELFNLFGDSAQSWELDATKLIYQSKRDVYVLYGTCTQTSEFGLNYNQEKKFVLEYKKNNNSNYIVSFSVTK